MTTTGKRHLKSEFALFQTSSILFHFILNLSKVGEIYWGFECKFRKKKKKENVCVVFTYSIKRAREILKFHVAVVQRRLRNVQNHAA